MVMSKVDFTSKIIESCMGDMLSFIERDEDDVLLNPPAPETYSVEWLKEKRTQWRYERLQRRNHDGDPNKTNDLTRARKVLLPEGEMLRREKELFDLGVRVSSLTNLDIEGKGHDMWLRAHERWHAAGALTDMLLDLEERETNTRDSVIAALDDIVDEVVIRRKEIERSEDETEISANFQDWLKKRKQQWKRGRLSSMLIAYKDGLGRLGGLEYEGMGEEEEEEKEKYGLVESFPYIVVRNPVQRHTNPYQRKRKQYRYPPSPPPRPLTPAEVRGYTKLR